MCVKGLGLPFARPFVQQVLVYQLGLLAGTSTFYSGSCAEVVGLE